MRAGSALLALSGVATGVAAVRVRRTERELIDLQTASARRQRRARELELFSRRRTEVVERTETALAVLDGGTSATQLGHQLIAAIPFAILEAIPVTRPVTKVVHGVHDATADSVYKLLGVAAREASRRMRESLAPPE